MNEISRPTGRQIAAARALAGLSQDQLAKASVISIQTLRRMEASEGPASGYANNVAAVRAALEAAGIEFTNGGQLGVRMRRDESHEGLTKQIETLKGAHPPVDHAEPKSPQKAMRQLKHAHAKNEIVTLKNRRAKHPKGK